MKKKSILIYICAIALTFTACGTDKAAESTDITKEDIVKETNELENSTPVKENEITKLPFLSAGSEVPDNGRYPLIFDEIYFDQPSFRVESDGNVTSFRQGGQALLSYVNEDKKSFTSNDELLDYFIMDEATMFFKEHIESATVVKSYNIESQEDVTIGNFDCTHYIIKLACSYPDLTETEDYSFEAYCFYFLDYPMVMAGVVRNPDSYVEKNSTFIENARSDISNNLTRMISTISSEKH